MLFRSFFHLGVRQLDDSKFGQTLDKAFGDEIRASAAFRAFKEKLGFDLEKDLDDVVVAGDVAICEDLGLDAPEMLMICEDDEAYIDEMVRTIAKRLGFARELAEALRRR